MNSRSLRHNRSFAIQVLLLFVVSVLLRWAVLNGYLLDLGATGPEEPMSVARSAFLFGDSESYFTQAGDLANSGAYGFPYRPPLYRAFLALSFLLFSATYGTAHVVQILLGSFIPVLFALLAGRWFTVRTALITGWLTAASFPLIILSTSLCSETLYVVLISAGLLMLESRFKGAAAAAGLLFGLSILTRSEGAVFVIPVAIFEMFRRWKCGGKGPAVIITLAITVLFWSVRNYVYLNMHHPQFKLSSKIVPVSSNGAINFYLGNGPMASGGYRMFSNALQHEYPEDRVNFEDPVHREAFFHGFQAGLDHLVLHPERIGELFLNKSRFFFRGFRSGFGVSNFPLGLRGSLRRGDMWTPESPASAWALLLLALAGWACAIKHSGRPVVLCAGFTLVSYTGALLFFGLARNAAAVLPFIFTGIALLIDCIWIRLQKLRKEGTAEPPKPALSLRKQRFKPVTAAGYLLIAWLITDAIRLMIAPVVIPSTNAIFSGLPTIADIQSNAERIAALERYESTLSEIRKVPGIMIMEEAFSTMLTNMTILINGDDIGRMETLLISAIDRDPSNAAAWKLRGFLALRDPDRKAEAIRMLERYTQINPWAPDAGNILNTLAQLQE